MQPKQTSETTRGKKPLKYIKISELERRQELAEQETKEQRAMKKADELQRRQRRSAEVEANDKAAAAAALEAMVAAAAQKRATLLDRFKDVSGKWAERVASELEQTRQRLECQRVPRGQGC